jgi:hypothetical protein
MTEEEVKQYANEVIDYYKDQHTMIDDFHKIKVLKSKILFLGDPLIRSKKDINKYFTQEGKWLMEVMDERGYEIKFSFDSDIGFYITFVFNPLLIRKNKIEKLKNKIK